jgi:hypothetical protein
MAKKIDPKAKAKRQKIMVAVGGVILLGLLAFQVPRTMKMLNQQGADSAAATSTPASTTPTAISSSAAAGATPVSAGVPGGLGDLDSLPSPQSGQLLAFSRFRTKDPFAQQLDLACAGSGTSSDGGTASCGSGSASASTSTSTSGTPKSPKAPARPSSAGGSVAPASPTAPPVAVARPTTASISVNGIPESVHVGADFPSSSPTFTLVSLTTTSAKIAIAGGSLEGGSATVTLTKGKPLTLMNTADGTRYVLRLVSVS